MVGKGQPPKPPEEIRKAIVFYASDSDKIEIVEAKEKECGKGASLSTYIKDTILAHARKVNQEK